MKLSDALAIFEDHDRCRVLNKTYAGQAVRYTDDSAKVHDATCVQVKMLGFIDVFELKDQFGKLFNIGVDERRVSLKNKPRGDEPRYKGYWRKGK